MAVDTYGKRINAGNFAPGSRLFTGGDMMRAFAKMLQGGLNRADNLTATAGGTKAAALALKNSLNRLSVCATANDSALLPKAIAGSIVTVTNSGAAAAAIYGAGTDTINGNATATLYSLAAGKTAMFVCVTTGAWFAILSA